MNHSDAAGKRIADEALAHRATLLASLGRKEELEDLAATQPDRVLDGAELSVLWRETLDALKVMRSQPGRAYRCGTYALEQVAYRLRGVHVQEIISLPSPPTGFSVADLEVLASKHGLGLRAVISRL